MNIEEYDKDADLEYVARNWDHYKKHGIPGTTQIMFIRMLGSQPKGPSSTGELAGANIQAWAAVRTFRDVMETKDPDAIREFAERYKESTSFRGEIDQQIIAEIYEAFTQPH